MTLASLLDSFVFQLSFFRWCAPLLKKSLPLGKEGPVCIRFTRHLAEAPTFSIAERGLEVDYAFTFLQSTYVYIYVYIHIPLYYTEVFVCVCKQGAHVNR